MRTDGDSSRYKWKLIAWNYLRRLRWSTTRTGKINTASNLEHRMKVILKNAELQNVKGEVHIFRKTFATRMYESGARVEEIAAYIGDLESTTRKYYIAIRKKIVTDGEVCQVVKLPGNQKNTVEWLTFLSVLKERSVGCAPSVYFFRKELIVLFMVKLYNNISESYGQK